MLPLKHRSSAERKCWVRPAAEGECGHRPALGPTWSGAWMPPGAGAGSGGSVTHTDGPGLHLWNLSSLGTTREPSPREDAGLMGSLPGRGCADPGAGEAPGKQGPTEGRPLTALTLRSLQEPRPASFSQLLQVLSWGGRGLYGYRSQDYQRRDCNKNKISPSEVVALELHLHRREVAEDGCPSTRAAEPPLQADRSNAQTPHALPPRQNRLKAPSCKFCWKDCLG